MPTGDDDRSFADMLAEYDGAGGPRHTRNPRLGEEVTGTVVAIGTDSVFVDVGAKSEGAIDRAELVDDDGALTVSVGDRVTARVADLRDDNVLLRIRMGRGQSGEEELARAYELGLSVKGKVTGVNKGGVDVEVGGVRGFCPISQLSDQRVEDATEFVGRDLEFKITQYEGGRGHTNVVLSHRRVLDAARAQAVEELRGKLELGAVLTGTVTRVVDFGAFVDLGGLEGLLHVSELGFGRVAHPSDVLTAGETVQVKVVKLEAGKEGRRARIGLSLKALQPDPWQTSGLAPGTRVEGRICRLEPFGAFIALADGVEGLVHVSELSDTRRVGHPKEVVSVGDAVEAIVLGMDAERRRLSLSIKAVGRQREADNAAGYERGKGQSLGTLGDLLKR